MADESEETLDERIDRLQRRAENFRELLKDGDEVTIGLFDGEMLVEESYRSKFERKHPKLFGRMLSIEAQMEAGLFPYFAGLIFSGVVLFGLQLEWWTPWLSAEVCDLLNRWWFYAALPLTMSFLMYLLSRQWEKWIYRRHRQALGEIISAEKLDRDAMLVMLRDERDLSSLVYALKLDNTGVRSQKSGP